MSRVINTLQAVARHEINRRPYCELAVVTSVFDDDDGPDAQTVSITLKNSGLAIPRVPVAVGLTGTGALPRPGDVVVVLFPGGDLNNPIVAGQVYSDQRRPPKFKKDEAMLVWPGDVDDPETEAVQLSVKAQDDARELSAALGGDKNAKIAMTDGQLALTTGGVTIKLAHSSDSDGQLEIAAGGTSIQLSQDGDVTIESAGTLTLKGSKVAIEGDTQVTVNGQTVEIN